MKLLENQIFSIENNADFEKTALDVFQFQREKCSVYKEYLKILNHPFPKTIDEIPFLPISFFKSHTVISSDLPIQFDFFSSGTTGMIRSKHSVQKPEMYQRSFTKIYKDFIGDPQEQVILALLPNYIEQGHSSLVYMVNDLIKETNSPLSGFFLQEYDNLVSNYQQAIGEGKKVVVFGVSYALLDLADAKVDLSQAQIIETGGMKGRRAEMTKVELHNYLKKGLGCDFISSEYGMTELFSQAYSNKEGVFSLPKWMDIKIRQTNDPFQYVKEGKTGGVNVIDLANLYSCSFIATQDLGKRIGEDFYLMGRFDNSDLRGCNMMVE
jgi:Acyl-protein synthetase, LuxE